MNTFTYRDYLKSIHTIRLNAVLQVAESEEKYNLYNQNIIGKRQNKIQNTHDKLIKNVLKNKKEMAKFINQFLKPKEKVNPEELIKYTNSYINKKYKSKEADIVYKLKNKDIFFLVEHQSTIDYNMSYRILNYCVEIIQEWIRGRNLKKRITYPIVVPIVIYTGKDRWNVEKNFKDTQMKETTYGEHRINLKYNFININKVQDKYLLDANTLFGYAMLIEKSRNKSELKKKIGIIIDKVKDNEILDEIARIIIYLLSEDLENSDSDELLEIINKKVGEKEMKNTLVERIQEENEQIRRKARKETKINIAEKLLTKDIPENTIIEIAEISAKELEKIKNKMKIQKPIL